MVNVATVNSFQRANVLNDISKANKTSETNFKDTVSEIERINAVKEKIEKEIPGVYLNVVDCKKINGFQPYSYPIDKIFQKNLTLKDFNSFPRPKNCAPDSQEMYSMCDRCVGKRAVLIHPDTLDKMSKDPEYADKIISQVKRSADKVGTCPDPAYPRAMTTSMVVGVDENGSVSEQLSTGISLGISESTSGVRSGKSRRNLEKERLEEYLEKIWYERKLTEKSIMELQINRKQEIARRLSVNFLKSNPYDLD